MLTLKKNSVILICEFTVMLCCNSTILYHIHFSDDHEGEVFINTNTVNDNDSQAKVLTQTLIQLTTELL